MPNWSEIESHISGMMKSLLFGFFDTRMRNVYGSNYMCEVQAYCIREESNPEGKVQRHAILDKIRANGLDAVSPKDDFDVSILGSLIRFGFRSDFESLFSGSNLKAYKDKVRAIVEARNKVSHDLPLTKDELKWMYVLSDAVLASESLLDFLECSSEWNERGKASYITGIRVQLNSIRELMLTSNSHKGSARIAVVDAERNIINGMQLELICNGTIVASWKSNDKPIVLQLSSGRYTIHSIEEANGYKLCDEVFEISGANGLEEKVFDAKLVLSDEGFFLNAFTEMLEEKPESNYLPKLQYLNQRNYLPALLLLAFLYRYGLFIEKNERAAQSYLETVEFIVDVQQLKSCAEEASAKNNLVLCVVYNIGWSMISDEGQGYYEAGRVFISKMKNYLLCRKCFELAAAAGYSEAEKPFKYLSSITQKQFCAI